MPRSSASLRGLALSLDVDVFLDKHTHTHTHTHTHMALSLPVVTILAFKSFMVALQGELELLIKEFCTVMTSIDFQFPVE